MSTAVDHESNGSVRDPTFGPTLTSDPRLRPVRFSLSISTHYGQHIHLVYTTSPDVPLRDCTIYPLQYEHPDRWVITLSNVYGTLRYKYILLHDDPFIDPIWEAGPERFITLSLIAPLASNFMVRDKWRASPDSASEIFSTDAFTRVLFRTNPTIGLKLLETRISTALSTALSMTPRAIVVIFRVFVERVQQGDVVHVVGNIPELGDDDPTAAIPLADTHSPTWQAAIATSHHSSSPILFRYIIKRGGTTVAQDQCYRELHLSKADESFLNSSSGTCSVVYAPSEDSFKFELPWRGAGIAIPVFSIRSRTSCGVGEFMDLIKFVDFCKAAGYQLLQLLPINDTNVFDDYRDSYPYSAVSSFALHPQYLNIDQLGPLPGDLQKEYEKERTRLNEKCEVDVVDVMRSKNRLIRELYKLNRDKFLHSPEFTQWFSQNQNWLVPYALFRFFMTINGTAQYDLWGCRKKYDAIELSDLTHQSSFHFDYIGVVYFTQFYLHKQLKAAADYAAENGVVFKGDLPIGVNRFCTDTWVNPHLFRLHMQAGAPPDYFSKFGQNWLFPTYDWDVMKKDNYGWWRSRLGHMARYFHAYRIDHILGFFRIWEIPQCFRTGMSGRFFPAYAISRQEIESTGLWDIERCTKPYVHDGLLQHLFHDDWWKIKEEYFQPMHGRLSFKEKYNTEKKVEAALTLSEDATEQERQRADVVKKKLFELLNNVCLLQDEDDENLFHPRFMMQTTSSYTELPADNWKRSLLQMQEDYIHKRQNELWRRNGLERLPMMKSASNMLVCGEDLGMVPECVPDVLERTCILGLAVQRMPSGDAEFGIPSKYKYECVATTSSHDTSTFRGWWEEIPADVRMRYWTDVMQCNGQQRPPENCTPDIVQWVIEDHLKSPAMWAIFPLQDVLGIDKNLRRKDAKSEQINDPSNPNHVWNFRLHIAIDEVMENEEFMENLLSMNKKHKRGAIY